MSETTLLLVRLGIILVCSHGAGFLCAKVFKLPRVLGEMGAGVILGYNLLGKLNIFGQTLFTPEIMEHSFFQFFISMATIILLFNAGMHTDIRFFIKFFLKGALVGMSGVIASFLGASLLTVYFFPNVESILDPTALFMGIATATSVGVSARILSEKNKLNSIEGNISITAAVLDDVLGIILLAIVTAITLAIQKGNPLNLNTLIFIAGKEIIAWVLLTIAGVFIARLLGRYIRILTPYTTIGMTALGFVLLMSGVAERLGLSAVIGAYIIGLGFSSIDIATEIEERITDLSSFFVPVFFTITGIQIDFSLMKVGILFSILYAFGTLFLKVIACGAVSGLIGFNFRGMSRIGTIMLPRGEVTLVIANIGLGLGVLSHQMFGTLAFTVFLSVLLTPILLIFAFKDDAPGYKKKLDMGDTLESFTLEFLNAITQAYIFDKMVDTFQTAGYFTYIMDPQRNTYLFRKNDTTLTIKKKNDGNIVFSTSHTNVQLIKLFVLEEIADMQENLYRLKHTSAIDDKNMEKSIMAGVIQKEKQGIHSKNYRKK